MCEYCEGVEGKPLESGTYFVAVIEPYHCRLRVDHCCDFCGICLRDYVPVNHCPMCGRDLRGEKE